MNDRQADIKLINKIDLNTVRELAKHCGLDVVNIAKDGEEPMYAIGRGEFFEQEVTLWKAGG